MPEIVRRDGDWLAARVGADVVMMSAAEGAYLRLNGVGGRVWELIEEPRSRDDLYAALIVEYDVAPNDCRQAVDELLAKLVKRRAVRIG